MTVQLYGDLPGVTAEVRGGAVSQITVGYEQVTVLFGRGDDSAGEASYNDPQLIQSPVQADTQFGADTRLAEGLTKALENGANADYLYGVMPTETSVSAEAVSGGSGTLSNAPIVEETDTISVQNTTAAQSETPVFRHESPPATGTLESDEVAINPNTGEVEAGNSDDYEIDYAYLEWADGLDAADTIVGHNEVAVYGVLSDAESVASTLGSKLDEQRPTYKLLRGVAGAQPNTTTSDGDPELDTSSYTDNLDNDALFVCGPVRRADDPTRTILGGITGVFGGHTLQNPIYGDPVEGYGSLVQSLTSSEEGDPVDADGSGGNGLRGEQIIPVRDSARDGDIGITLEDSLSTSTATDYPRDYHRRRIVDQVLISGREVGETLRGQRVTSTVLSYTEQSMLEVLEELANDGLLESGGQQASANPESQGDENEQLFSAQLNEVDTDTYALDISFRPVDIAKNIEETLIVDRSSTGA